MGLRIHFPGEVDPRMWWGNEIPPRSENPDLGHADLLVAGIGTWAARGTLKMLNHHPPLHACPNGAHPVWQQ